MLNSFRNHLPNVKCTICSNLVEQVYEHSILKVSICKACSDSLKSSDKTNACCFWCGHGKDMLFCVQCRYQCCVECITRNLDTEYIDAVNEKNWSCFVCDSDPVKEHQKQYLKIVAKETSNATVPETSGSTIDISSPHIIVDDDNENTEKESDTTHCQDLDFILNVYEKQIQSSLELEDANIPAIICEIKSIRTEQLSSAIYSYKKCLNAFMSDLTNLEARVSQSEAFNNPATFIKLTSLLRILVQHHIFNRICHPQTRMKDDHAANSNNRKQSFPAKKSMSSAGPSTSVVMVIDPTKRKNIVIKPHSFERKDAEVNEMVSKIKDLCNKQRNNSDDDDFEPSICGKRQKLSASEEKISRRARSLVTPSWLSDFKVENETDILEPDLHEMVIDQEWTDPRIKRSSFTGKRGRPPKYRTFSEESYQDFNYLENLMSDDNGFRRGRGRPRKTLFINVKEPRYCVQKKNGENLISSL